MVQSLKQYTYGLPTCAFFDWSAPPDGLIDGVVTALKRTGRWSRDGRSLRRLNRHWCQALNHHVDAIHPHCSRVISQEAAQQLLKFPNLTSLDVTPFLIASGSEWGWSIISSLPNLRHVVMDTRVLCLSGGHHVRAMTGLSSLHVRGTGIPPEALQTLQLPNLTEFKGCLMECQPSRCTTLMPSLRRLHLGVYTASSRPCEDIEVEDVRLVVVGDIAPLKKISSVVSLECLVSQPDGFGRVKALSNLKHLTMPVTSSADFDGPSFDYVIKRLESLKLVGQSTMPLSSKFWNKVGKLQSLSLQSFRVDAADVTSHHLPHLDSLCLIDCLIKNDVVALSALTTLTSLEMRRNTGLDNRRPQMDMDLSPLHRLKLLHVQFGRGEGPTKKLLSTIAGLTNLESLNLENIKAPYSNRLLSTDWEILGALPQLSKLSISGVTSLSVLETILNLSFICDLDGVHLIFDIWHTEISVLEDMVRSFREAAPNVKLSTRLSVRT